MAGRHRGASLPAGTHRLRGVLDYANLIGGRESFEGVEIAGLAEEVHRHNRASAGRDFPSGVGEIDVEVVRVDVDPDGGRAETSHGARGSKEGEGREKDLVAFTDVESHEREQERVSTGRDAESMLYAEECGTVLLKGLEARAHDEHI